MNWEEFYQKAVRGIAISDGAMGTMLQKKGLTGEDCPEEWNVSHAEDIYEVQKAYVDAGSEMLTTNTFGGNRLKLKNYHLEDRLEELNRAGVEIAKKAAGNQAIVAGSIGPTGKFIKPLGPLEFDEMVEIYREQIEVLAKAGVDCFTFETHVDILELKAGILAVRECEASKDLPIIASVTFEADSLRTVTGTTPEAAFTTLEALGCDIVGTNCSNGPEGMAELIRRVRGVVNVPMIAQANAGLPRLTDEGETVFDLGADDFTLQAVKMVKYEEHEHHHKFFGGCSCGSHEDGKIDIARLDGVNVIGGCCGTTPQHIKQLKEDAETRVSNEDGKIDVARLDGVNVIGGCCGTTPQHIKRLKEDAETRVSSEFQPSEEKDLPLTLSSRYQIHKIGHGEPFTVIGERLNPTARKKLARDMESGDFTLFREEASAQEAAGADILDLNAGVAGADEAEIMKSAVEILSMTVQIPFAIDSADPEAARVGMRLYPGKPLLNSISAEPERLELLPDVAKYGAAFIALPIDENGIPETAEERVAILKRIIELAEKYGIEKRNIIADPLVLTASANQQGAKITLETVRAFTQLNILTTMGLSNISFGLPVRQFVNRSFLAMSSFAGLTSAIMNPMDSEMMGLARAGDVLLSRDKNSARYIEKYAGMKLSGGQVASQDNQITVTDTQHEEDRPLFSAVIKGNKDGIIPMVKAALGEGQDALSILNECLIPGITKVGDLYEKKVYFLPQLMMAAEAMKAAFSILEPLLKENAQEPKGKVVFATVKGDVHDIGKNIVCILLSNYGFEVVDMGKDIENEAILEKAIEIGADIVALSALMTTTMPRMPEFIHLMKSQGQNFSVMVGGAAVTQEYADKIGAIYSRDAVSAVRAAEEIMKQKR